MTETGNLIGVTSTEGGGAGAGGVDDCADLGDHAPPALMPNYWRLHRG